MNVGVLIVYRCLSMDGSECIIYRRLYIINSIHIEWRNMSNYIYNNVINWYLYSVKIIRKIRYQFELFVDSAILLYMDTFFLISALAHIEHVSCARNIGIEL